MAEEIKEPKAPEGKAPEERKSTEMIDKANEAAARLERANIEHAKIVAREEALHVEKTLGGKADAGLPPPKEESPEVYAQRIMAGEEVGNKQGKKD